MPNTIAENLVRLQNAKTAIANAITVKGGTVAAGDGLEDFPTDIATIPSGSSSVSANDVTFYDYDGTVVNAYSKTDFLALSAMPANPSHEGLTAQGWNWSLQDAKTYVTKYGRLNIGQMYITSDGKTRIKIKLEEGRLSPVLGLGINGSVDVDWGDGTAHGTMTGSNVSTLVQLQHVYAAAGEYTIVLDVTGSIAFLGNNTYGPAILRKANVTNVTANESHIYQNAVQEVFIGSGVTSIDDYAFQYCYSLTFVIVPDGVTSIGGYVFRGCNSLFSITIPDGVTSIGDNIFSGCHALSIITIPDSVTSINASAFSQCSALSSITIPNDVTYINNYTFSNCKSLVSVIIPDDVTYIGTNAFQDCTSLTSITIPDGVTSIGNYAFQNCYSFTSITIPGSVTSIGSNAFYNCKSLVSVIILDGVTSIGNYAFQYCCSLISVTIPDSVISIGDNAFQSCYSLISVTIPDGVTSIGNYAFDSCTALAFIQFNGDIPPTISNSNTFNYLPTDCTIYVPSGSLSVYTSATNYPDPNTYTYIEY